MRTAGDMQASSNGLEDLILKYISDSEERQPSWRIEQYVSRVSNLFGDRRMQRKEFKCAIKRLVSRGELGYTYQHGCSFLELSFQRPVRISTHVVLKPPGLKGFQQPGDKEIELMHGASFGTGRHPTTRLSIKGIEFALQPVNRLGRNQRSMSLDIGTGSGVLAIASVLLGIHKAVGIDLEVCARKEARENVQMNGLSDRIDISDLEFENITGGFELITANLRYPTLVNMIPQMTSLVGPGGRVVVSGIYDHEMEKIFQKGLEHAFKPLWRESEKGWVGIVFEK